MAEYLADRLLQSQTSLSSKLAKIAAMIILVIFCLYVLFAVLIHGGHGDPTDVDDMVDMRLVILGYHAYAVDNDDQLPAHAAVIAPEIIGAVDSKGYAELFTSNVESLPQSNIDYDSSVPDSWYRYGSYWFYPTADLLVSDVQKPERFILVYRPPADGYPYYIAGFLDGRTEALPKAGFQDIKNNQESLIRKITVEAQIGKKPTP